MQGTNAVLSVLSGPVSDYQAAWDKLQEVAGDKLWTEAFKHTGYECGDLLNDIDASPENPQSIHVVIQLICELAKDILMFA